MIFDLQVVQGGASRTIRVRAEHTLEDVHRAIDGVFLRDVDPAYAFRLGPRLFHPPDLAGEFGGESAVATIGSLSLALGTSFEYSIGHDPWEPENGDPEYYQVRVVGVGGEAAAGEPRVIEAKGELPYRPRTDFGGAEQEEEKA